MTDEHKTPKLATIPSCGLALLRGPLDSFDYVIRITSNEKTFVHVNCHRCVLLAHSKKMGELIRNENFWDMDIKVRPGYISAIIELIQYMYLKDISLVTEKSKILELCGLFEMPLDFFLIRTESLDYLNQYPTIKLNIESDASECITTIDFLKRLTIEKAKLTAPTIDRRESLSEVINQNNILFKPKLSSSKLDISFQKTKKNERKTGSMKRSRDIESSMTISKDIQPDSKLRKYNLRSVYKKSY